MLTGAFFYRRWCLLLAMIVLAGVGLSRGFHGNAQPPEKRLPALIEAITHYDDAKVLALLQAGADPNTLNDTPAPGSPTTALLCAVNAAYYSSDTKASTIRALLAHGANVNASDGYGGTPLIAAAKYNRTDLVALLLQAGANPNAAISHYGPVTALMAAVEHGNAKMVRLLLQRGADPNIKMRGKSSKSLLAQEQAVAQQHAEIVRLLRQHGAKE